MAEKMSEVYEAYDMEIYQTMRGRGAFILNTDKGVRQVKQLDVNESRLKAEYQFKEKLVQNGFTNIDRCIKNNQDELITYDRYGNPFVVREFFDGREMNINNIDEILTAVKNLAEFHRIRSIDRILYTTLVKVVVGYMMDCFFVEEKKLRVTLKREIRN